MRFKGLDLNLLQVLDMLIDQRSVTRAAQLLHVSQPAISAALARLRLHFEDPLLVQHGKRMIPTPFALRLQPGVKSVLGDLEALVNTPAHFDPATSIRQFRVMASDFILVAVLGDLLPQIEQEAPHIRLDIVSPQDDAIAMLEAGELDLLITPSDYVSDRHPAVNFFQERHVVAGWAENPLVQSAPGLDDLRAGRFISALIGRSATSSFANHQLALQGIMIKNALTTTTFGVVPQLLVGTGRLAILHESLARKAAQHLPIRYWPLPVAIPDMHEAIQCHRARVNDPAMVWLIDRLTQWSAGVMAERMEQD
ncbi:LysR family transcriptional regulator [Novosphingobium humi]|uniref:LysR family transcriptional regulator n=1 Tax=Novosphingobium humi TaxID=2282397 RepID=A0ABY7U3V5_9SPHN|nr:LysR family transcriptional regulator [Novosphingobium humi]WCT79883.1 LysR family transcriptional regulator [Novosphingobium humi]WJT00950.1 LysR family transcriptional regulator [Novosphingobium humi]